MNLKNIFRRSKASSLPPLAVCSAIAVQHGFLQFYIVKVFIADFKAPAISLIHGALWEICIRFSFSLAAIIALIAFPKSFLIGLKSPKLLILLAIVSSMSFMIPWHREIYKSTNFTFHFSLSLILSEFCTVAIATFVTNGLSIIFKTSSHPHMLLLMTEATITASFIVIPVTQILTQNFKNFLIFQEITYFISGFGMFTLAIGSFFWPKQDKQLVSNEIANVSKIQKRFSVKFTKAVKNQIKINFGKSARGTGGSHGTGSGSGSGGTRESNIESNEVPPATQPDATSSTNPSTGNRSPLSIIWSPHFIFPLIGRIFRQSRIVVNCTMLYFTVEVLLVQAEALSPTGISVPLIYFLSLSLHTVIFYYLISMFKDAGPVVINHLLALVSIINLTAMLIFGRQRSLFFAIFLIIENTLSRCSCSTIYGMFESFLFESLKKHNASKKLSAKHLHLFASLFPNAVETASLILVISVLHISGFQKYISIQGFHREKCDPIPHRAPGVLNRLMGRNWGAPGEFEVDSRIENLNLTETVTVDFPLSFFACEGLIEIIYLFGSIYPLLCAIGEFTIMYLYRKHFKLEGGRIVPN